MIKKGTGPSYLRAREAVDTSPLPWTWAMIRDWMLWSDGQASKYLVEMVIQGYIWRIEKGLYGPISAKPLFRHRGPKVIVTDEMLARYGFNL